MIFLRQFKKYSGYTYSQYLYTDQTNIISHPIINSLSYGYRLRSGYVDEPKYMRRIQYMHHGLFLNSIILNIYEFIDRFCIERLVWEENYSKSYLYFEINSYRDYTFMKIHMQTPNNLLKLYPIVQKTTVKKYTIIGNIKIENIQI